MLYTHPHHKQKGAVLIVSLMLLIVLTMLGVSALNSTKFETRMAANTAEYNRTFQAAEIGIAVPRTYRGSALVEISNGAGKTETNNAVEDYEANFTTQRLPGTYVDKSGRFGYSSARLVYFQTNSTGMRQTAENDLGAIEVRLRGGLSQPAPAGGPHVTH